MPVRGPESTEGDEQFLAAVIKAAPDGIVIQDDRGRIVLCNVAAADLLGLRNGSVPAEGMPAPDWDAVREDGTPLPESEYPAAVVLRTGVPQRGVIMGIRHPSRGRVWLNASAAMIEGWGGRSPLVTTTFSDISTLIDRRRRRQRAVAEARVTQFAVDRAGEAVAWLNPEGRFLYVNDSWARLIGYSREELLNMSASDLNPDHPPPRWQEHWNELKRAGTLTFEASLRRKDGSVVEVEISANYMAFEGTEFNIAFLRDISERKLAQRRLEDSEARLRATLENTPNVAVQWYDLEGRVVYWNNASEVLYGWSASEAIGKTLDELIYTPEEAAEFIDLLRQAHRDGMRIGPEEYRFRRRDGSVGYILATIFPIPGEGESPYCACMDVDITARRTAADAMQRTIAALTRSNAELERLAFVASHDLQEPSRSVALFAQLLSQRYGDRLDEEGREFLAYLDAAARRMFQLVGDLLDYARAARHEQSFEPVDMNRVVETALANMHVAIRQAGAEITVDPLPEVHGDPMQLLQVVQNLLSNALKFQRPNVPPRVRMTAAVTDDEIVFSIRDNGIGIAPEYQKTIFEIFRRLHTMDAYPGTRVGLAICKRVIDQHHGRIWVESAAGQGAVFHFALPRPETSRNG